MIEYTFFSKNIKNLNIYITLIQNIFKIIKDSFRDNKILLNN